MIEKAEKQKGFPSLNGLESAYSQVKLHFDPNLEKKLVGIARVSTGQNEFSGDFTTNSGSFLPPFSFHEEEECNEGLNQVKQSMGNDALNLSNISFNEPASPINQTAQTIIAKTDNEEIKE